MHKALSSADETNSLNKTLGQYGRLSPAPPRHCPAPPLGLCCDDGRPSAGDRFYSELLSAGVVAPLSAAVQGLRPAPPGSRHLVAPEGTNSIVRHFLSRADVSPEFGRRVTEVRTAGLPRLEPRGYRG